MEPFKFLILIAVSCMACGEPVSYYGDKPSSGTAANSAPIQPKVVAQASPSYGSNDTYTVAAKPGGAQNQTAAESTRIVGKVTETMDSSGYTYAAVQKGDGSVVWTAGPQTSLKVGDSVDVQSRTKMTGFSSKTLNRTFDRIFFVTSYGASAVGTPPLPGAVNKKTAKTPPKPTNLPPNHGANATHSGTTTVQPSNPHANTAAASKRITGKVTETMDSGGYTYAAIQKGGAPVVWTAGPQTALKVGDVVDVKSRTEMTGFSSKTLNRTFDRIFFVSTYGASAATTPSQRNPAIKETPKDQDESLLSTIDALANGTSGSANTYTVQNLIANAALLNGAQVSITGKVVKYNAGIMGKNWLHIQDGTGNPAQNTHDITVTTLGTAKVGDSVTVKATVATNRDFGAGYSYAIILENAQLTPAK